MSQNQTIESVEAEAARVRAQLVDVGTDLRAHVDPSRIVEAAKVSLTDRAEHVPRFLRRNASPILLVLLGGAFGAAMTGFLSPKRRSAQTSDAATVAPDKTAARSSTKTQIEAAMLSTVGVGLGYVGGMLLPSTPLEEKYLGAPKAAMSAQLDAFLNQHVQGMKLATANLFGISRLSASMLISMAAAADMLGVTKSGTGRKEP